MEHIHLLKRVRPHISHVLLVFLFALILTLGTAMYLTYSRQQEVRAIEGQLNIGTSGTGMLGGFACSAGAVLHITNMTGQTRCSDVLYVDKDVNSKRVGVGTNDPLAKFHVAGGNILLNNAQGYAVRDTVGTNVPLVSMSSGNLIQFGDYSGVTATDVGIFTQGSERVRITSLGRVGIGTTSPGSYLLDVANRARIRSGSLGTGGIWFAESGGTERSFVGLLSDTASPSVGFFNTGAWRQIIDENGNMGLAVTDPDSLLHMKGSSPVLNIQNTNGTGGTGSTLRFGHDQLSSTLPLAEIRSVLTNGGGAGFRAGEISFLTSAAGVLGHRVRITADGKLGIGTTAPSAALDIALSGGAWTTAGWQKAIEVNNANVIKWQANAGGQRHAIGQTTGGLYFARSSADDNSQPVNYDVVINDSGFVTVNSGMTVPYIEDIDSANYYLDPSQASVLSHLVVGQASSTNLFVRNTSQTINNGMTFFQTQDASASNEYFNVMQRTNASWAFVDNEFLFRTDGTANADGSFTGGGADVAEMYFVNTASEPGDLVAIEKNTSVIKNPGKELRVSEGKTYDSAVVGVISTNPGLVAGNGDNDTYINGTDPRKPIALTGRVPVKVSLENGPIKAGDYLTSSSRPGVAMKAHRGGKVIGQALEDYDGKTKLSAGVRVVEEERLALSAQNKPLNEPSQGIGKIMVYVQPIWYSPSSDSEKIEMLEQKLNKQQQEIDELKRYIKKN